MSLGTIIMGSTRGKIMAGGALFAAFGLVLSPAIGAVDSLIKLRASNPVSLNRLGSIASFTPSTQDSRLASVYARAVLSHSSKSFRFTPTSGSINGRRSITVLVRAAGLGQGDRVSQTVGIEPLAFNLDASRGWRKFALPDSVGRKPLDPIVTDLPAVKGFSLDRGRPRLKTNVQLDARADVGTAPQTLAGERKFSVDVGSSYSLTRNLNVTAGVRYAGPDNRLNPITDLRQDNQAVYVGTNFKF